MKVDPETAKILEVPPVGWDELVGKTDTVALGEVARKLASDSVYLARMAQYLESRYLGSNHAEAVKESNLTVAGVRKALGYTYPSRTSTSSLKGEANVSSRLQIRMVCPLDCSGRLFFPQGNAKMEGSTIRGEAAVPQTRSNQQRSRPMIANAQRVVVQEIRVLVTLPAETESQLQEKAFDALAAVDTYAEIHDHLKRKFSRHNGLNKTTIEVTDL